MTSTDTQSTSLADEHTEKAFFARVEHAGDLDTDEPVLTLKCFWSVLSALRTTEARTGGDALRAGEVRWHSSEEDGGPDVGKDIILPDGSHLYFGEVPNQRLEENGVSAPGWVIAHYQKGKCNLIGACFEIIHETDAIEELGSAVGWLGSGRKSPSTPQKAERNTLLGDEKEITLSHPTPADDARTPDDVVEKLRSLHEKARGCEFDLRPTDGPIAQLALFMHENGDQLLAALTASGDARALLEPSDDLMFILGRPSFIFVREAQLFRDLGYEIAKQAEAEQAFFIQRMLTFYLADPINWREAFAADIRVHVKRAKALLDTPPAQDEGDRG